MFKPLVNDMDAGVYHSPARYVQTEKQTKLKRGCSVIFIATDLLLYQHCKMNFALLARVVKAPLRVWEKMCGAD